MAENKTTTCEGETIVLRRLADAMDALQSAAAETHYGFVADYCLNAQREVRKAMRIAVGVGDEDQPNDE